MLDENLPTFFLRPSSDRVPWHTTLFLSTNASDLEPEYALHSVDPENPASKNTYSIALLDAHNTSVIFAEALSRLQWSQPSQSADDIRQNGANPPPPKPIWPDRFTLQLYNPDQQVEVFYHEGKWNSPSYWEFDMPIQSFRLPSTSAIDRAHDDPLASTTTPKLTFKWRKEGRFAKDLVCSLSSKGNLQRSKRSEREPEITIALFKSFKELIIYEPNLSRVEMEDLKGLEIVVLLSAAVIRDIFFGDMSQVFHIGDASSRKGSASGGRKTSATPAPPHLPPTATAGFPTAPPSALPPSNARPNNSPQSTLSRPPAPPSDPEAAAAAARHRAWQLAEADRLKAEERATRKRIEKIQKEDLRIKREEEREARRRAQDNEREARRIQQEYEAEQRRLGPKPSLPARPHSAQPGYRLQRPVNQHQGHDYHASSSGQYARPPQSNHQRPNPHSAYTAPTPHAQQQFPQAFGLPPGPQSYAPRPVPGAFPAQRPTQTQAPVVGGGVWSSLLSVGSVGNVLFGGGHHSSGHDFARPLKTKRSSFF